MISNSSDRRVVIVDDSPLVRQMLQTIIDEAEGMRVVGVAGDPLEAREVIKKQNLIF